MDALRNRSLEKIAGNSVIAWGIVTLPLGFATGTLDCNAFFLIWAGIAVRNGSRTGSFFALLFSALGFVGGVATVVSAATYGIAEVGAPLVIVAGCLVPWMLLNLAWLAQLRRRPSPVERSTPGDENAVASHENKAQLDDSTLRDDSGVVLTSILSMRPWFPQFSLLSLFVLAVLVALACAIGTRPIAPSRTWSTSWCGTAGKDTVAWSVRVVASRSGIPAIGVLWRSQGKRAGSPDCIPFSSSAQDFSVNGQSVSTGANFILFYNDAEDKPRRLEISKEEATKVFGDPLNMSQLETFWQEKIEPLRRKSTTKATAK
jgi:hypothetical protein